jgi:hypothetical protein
LVIDDNDFILYLIENDNQYDNELLSAIHLAADNHSNKTRQAL